MAGSPKSPRAIAADEATRMRLEEQTIRPDLTLGEIATEIAWRLEVPLESPLYDKMQADIAVLRLRCLTRSLDNVRLACEALILAHEVPLDSDVCATCGEPYPCWPRSTAEEVVEGLRRLALDSPAVRPGQQ